MPITARDRKLLWARAGGTCTLCKCQLTADATSGDRGVVLGEEAHIVSEELNGPRYRAMPRKEVDSYANLVLLCPSDHKKVDEQVTYYSEQRLQTLKRDHEQWVTSRVSAALPTIRIRDPEAGKPVSLQRIATGKELMSVVAHTGAGYHDYPEPRSAEEAEIIGGFLQNATDYGELWDDIGPSGRIQAAYLLGEEIGRLREAGLVVYAGARNNILEGGVMAPEPFPVGYILIRRADNASS